MPSSSSTTSVCCAEKPRRVGTSTRHSRSTLLLASVGVSVLFFLLDSTGIGQRTWSAELCFFAAGLLAAFVYLKLVGTLTSKSLKSSQQVDIRERLTALREHARLAVVAVKTKVRAFVDTVRQMRSRFTPAEGQLLSAQMVRTTAVTLVTLLVPLLLLPWLADMSGDADACSRLLFFDAAPRQMCDIGKLGADCPPRQSFSIRSTTWLVVAFLMSSGLCAVHPLQSGLLMAF